MGRTLRSRWVETEYGDVLLPIRVRAEQRGSRVRVVAYVQKADIWTVYKKFPWAFVGFIPDAAQLDTLAESGADALCDWLEKNEPAQLDKLLGVGPPT
jgi:hypothetical protein